MEKLLDFLDTVLVEWLGATLIGAAALITFLQVFTRNILGFTSVWADEMPRYIIILAVFVALAEGWRHGRNLRMTLLISRVPAWARRVARFIADVAGLAFGLYLGNAGLQLVLQQYQQQGTTGTSLNFPAWIPSLTIPLGAALLALASLAGLIRNMTGRWDPMAPEAEGGS